MNKGYIVPVILVVLLLVLAGFFVFSKQVVESPIVPNSPTPISTTTKPIGTPVFDDEDENPATTTVDTDNTQATTSTSTDELE